MAHRGICTVEGCGNSLIVAHGLCDMHYRRRKRYGDPLGGRQFQGEPQRYFREVILAYDGDECLLWPFGAKGDGYGVISLGGRQMLVSRAVCEEAHGPAPTPTHHAAHSCGNGHLSCTTKRHLSWKTPKGNSEDMVAHGNSIRGRKHHMVKLTEADVHAIRAQKGKSPCGALAKRFGVSRSLVSMIHTGKAWVWLKEEAR